MFLIARTAICKKGWPSIKIPWQCIQHLLLMRCHAFIIAYKNRNGLLLQYFVGVWLLKVFVSKICYKQYPEVFSLILCTMRKDGQVLLFPFFSCFSTEFFQISSSLEDQVQDLCGVMPTENLAPGLFLCMMNWQSCTCSQREQMEEIIVTISF